MGIFKRLAALAATMVLAGGTVGIGTAFAEEGLPVAEPSVLVDGATVYANGIAIVVKADSDGKTYLFDETGMTKLVESALPSNPTIYGGGKGVAVEGDTSVTIEGVKASTVYGGGWNAPVSGSTYVSVSNASTSTLYGGGYSDGTGDATVGGDVTVDLAGTGTKTGVHGGGSATATKGDACADVVGAVVVTCDDFDTGSAQGGGSAYSSSAFSASANVGSVQVTGAGRTYSVRGGGSANSTSEGSASADVLGLASLHLSKVDVREVYGGGYATGAQAHATAGSVDIGIVSDEVMILQGGGNSSQGGVADVNGAITTNLSECSNLYGYVVGGGMASTGGSSKASSASLTLVNCGIPVDEQFDTLVSAPVYGGGSASGEGSSVDIAGSVSLSITDSNVAGGLYGGGDASGGATASVGSVTIALKGVEGASYGESVYVSSLLLAGETDEASAATFGAYPVNATIEDCSLEHVWGALSGDDPLEVPGMSTVVLRGGTTLSTLACIDAIDIVAPLNIAMYLQNSDGPTTITAQGIATGEPTIVCDDPDLQAEWFALRNGELSYAVEEGKSVWRIAERRVPVEVVVPDPAAPQVTIDYARDKLEGLLTNEDRAVLNAGKPVSFALTVKALDPEAVEEHAKGALEKAVADGRLAIAQHLDVSFSKIVGDRETPIVESGTPIRLTFAIPEELLAQDGEDPRAFHVVRVHERTDGTFETTVLPDLDEAPETVTIETDRFSVYALAYELAAGEDPKPPIDPDDPADPDKPVVPDDPADHDKPVVPDDPTGPEQPSQPENPEQPEKPETPDKPVPPATPDEPETGQPEYEPEVVEKEPTAKSLPAGEKLVATGDRPYVLVGLVAILSAATMVASARGIRRNHRGRL